MKLPLQIEFRNLDPSPAIEAQVRRKAAKLERLGADVMSCRVMIELQHLHHQHGNLFHVRIDARLPGAELVATRSPSADHAHEDAHVAVRDAFEVMFRKVEEHVRRRRDRQREPHDDSALG